MKNIFSRFLTSMILILLSSGMMNAQNGSLDENIFTELRGHASFNVVFIVIAIIFIGLIATLVRIDRKVSRIEKEMKGPKS
ncbi:MAG: CcmD family protein [Bacteroidota bacterium]|nr:CcmD family protein [Bacteroidota bacterium]